MMIGQAYDRLLFYNVRQRLSITMAVMIPRTLALPALILSGLALAAEKPIPVKVVVVSMFERGADTGDQPGEFQYWVEREKLDRVLPLPQACHDVRMNGRGVL